MITDTSDRFGDLQALLMLEFLDRVNPISVRRATVRTPHEDLPMILTVTVSGASGLCEAEIKIVAPWHC